MSGWLGVVSAEHVRRGVERGFVQIAHGKRGPLARLHAGDTFVYYSPVERMGDTVPLRAFTALATIPDEEIWQEEEVGFRPFRRRADYAQVRPVTLEEVRTDLRLTTAPNWGYQLRRGLVPLEPDDVATLRELMTEI
jgi:hypothetical protein